MRQPDAGNPHVRLRWAFIDPGTTNAVEAVLQECVSVSLAVGFDELEQTPIVAGVGSLFYFGIESQRLQRRCLYGELNPMSSLEDVRARALSKAQEYLTEVTVEAFGKVCIDLRGKPKIVLLEAYPVRHHWCHKKIAAFFKGHTLFSLFDQYGWSDED